MTSNIKEIERVSIALDDIETHDEMITLDQWLNDWINYPANRHHEKNARTPKWQAKMITPHIDHYAVDGVICEVDITDPVRGVFYPAGTKIKTNGHTTGEFFGIVCREEIPDKLIPMSDEIVFSQLVPEKLKLRWHYVRTWEQLTAAFEVFDSKASVRGGSDRFFGAARINNITLPNFNKTESIAALEYSAHICYPKLYKWGATSSEEDANNAMNKTGKAWAWLDEIVGRKKFQNKIPLNPLLKTIYVASAQFYWNDSVAMKKLEDFVLYVSAEDVDSSRGQTMWDACSWWIKEWKQIITQTKTNQNKYKKDLSRGAESKYTISYGLYCIDQYIQDKQIGRSPTDKTIKNYIQTWQDRYSVNVANKTTQKSTP